MGWAQWVFFWFAVAWHGLEAWCSLFLRVEVWRRCPCFWYTKFCMCDLTVRCFSHCLCTNRSRSLNIHRWSLKMKSMWGTSKTWSSCKTIWTIDLISDDPIGFSGSGITTKSTECSVLWITRSKSSMCACPCSSLILWGSWLTLPWSILFIPWSILFIPTKSTLPWTCSLMSSLMSSVFRF